MQANNKIIDYSEAKLHNLDAGYYVRVTNSSNNEYQLYAVPSFLIIGAQKCGTTALHRWLSIHPELQTLPLEWNFFDEVCDIETEWPRYVINPYFKIRRKTVRHTFEKTPGYFYKTNRGIPVPDIVNKLMPSGKFIVMLRDPKERAWSAYKMIRNNAQKILYGSTLRDANLIRLAEKVAIKPRISYTEIKPFLETIQDLIALEHKDDQNSLNPTISNMLVIGHYAEHLQKWFSRFSREQLLVIFLEDFKKDPFVIMEQVLSFLEISPIDYKSITNKTVNGLWDLEGYSTSLRNKEYINYQAKELLDSYYHSWNYQLKHLLPELTIPWEI